MKSKLLFISSILMLSQIIGQQSANFFTPLDETIDETSVQQVISNLGNFNELVIPVGFSDRSNIWPVLSNNTYYPLHGIFPDETLLRDYINQNGGSIPIEDWYEPMLDDYFDTHSNNLHTVDFEFIKRTDGKPYTPNYSMAQWIVENNNIDTNIIWNKKDSILLHVVENMYADNQNVFDGINTLHFVFNVGSTNRKEFHSKYGGTIKYNLKLESNNIVYFEGPISINWKADAIPHERLHLMGLPDRGSNKSGMFNYGIMDNRGVIVSERSLYGQRPIKSSDLIDFGWVPSDEILVIDENNYQNFGEIKLVDLNYSLTSTQKSQGYYRFVKILINSIQYFLIEFHNATEYDKNFSNIDEYATLGYNKGILIWHNNDLEVAVPYNGWENRTPIPNDNYPRDYSRSVGYLGNENEGDFDWLNDIGVLTYFADGGRNRWSETLDNYNEPNNPMEWLERTNSKRTDFFTDKVIQGRIVNRMTDATRPSTKSKGWQEIVWDNDVGPLVIYHNVEKTHIGIVDIKEKSENGVDYMTVKVFYNYWEGEITENTTMRDNPIIGGDLTIASGVTLTIRSNVTIPNGIAFTVQEGATITLLNNSSLIVNGTLNIEGSSTDKVTFDFISQSSSPWNQISVGSGGEANIDHAIIKNARNGVYSSGGATINITNTEIKDCLIGVYALDSEVDILDCNIHDVGRGIQYYDVAALGIYSSIVNTYVTNASYEGIYIRYNSTWIKNNKISNCNYEGLRAHYNSTQYLNNNTIENSSTGVDCRDYTNAIMDHPGENLIDNNNYGLYVLYNGTISATDGSNTISNNNYHAFAYDSDIYAQGNYWGEVPPNSNKFIIYSNSTVDYSNYLTSNSGAGSNLAKTGVKSELELAYKEMFEENYTEAEKIFKKLIKGSFGEKLSKQALVGLNECYRKSKKGGFKEYLGKEVKEKINDKKGDMQEMYLELLSLQYAKEGKYSDAITILTEIGNNFSKDENKAKHILFSIGELHLFNNDIEAARASFAKMEKYKLDKRDLFDIENLLATAEQGTFSLLKSEIGSNNDNLQNQEEDNTPPKEYRLMVNYPNPFNPTTTIEYQIPNNGFVNLVVYNTLGQVVSTLVNEHQTSGKYSVQFKANNLPSGVYFYKIKSGSFNKVSKMILLR